MECRERPLVHQETGRGEPIAGEGGSHRCRRAEAIGIAAEEVNGVYPSAITARGRQIAAYDAAAWHGTDAVLALGPDQERVRAYLARRTVGDLWEVVFGRQSADADTFHVAYRAVQDSPGSATFVAEVVDPA